MVSRNCSYSLIIVIITTTTTTTKNKWYMYKPESVMENETHKLLLDHLISARQPDQVIVKKKKKKKKMKRRTCRTLPFRVTPVKLKASEKRDKCQDLA